jgi:hypothetical protein
VEDPRSKKTKPIPPGIKINAKWACDNYKNDI